MKSTFNVNPVALTAGAQTGGGLRSIDLFGRAPTPNNIGIAIKVTTSAIAPGASKNLTVHYALSTQAGLSVAQLEDADAEQAFVLPNAVTTTRVYTLPTILVGQRYLYIWFDNDALAGGATLTATPIINGS